MTTTAAAVATTTATIVANGEIGPNDVLLGRGGQTNNHNRKFRSIVQDHQREYLAARKKDKVLIARRIVAIVQQENGGRFLKRAEGSAGWIPVTDKRAQEKTSQALREGLDVRNNTIRRQANNSKQQQQPSRRRNSSNESKSSSAAKRQTKTTTAATAEHKRSSSPPSPAVVSLNPADNNYASMAGCPFTIPDLDHDFASPWEPSFLHYQPPPLSSYDLQQTFEV